MQPHALDAVRTFVAFEKQVPDGGGVQKAAETLQPNLPQQRLARDAPTSSMRLTLLFLLASVTAAFIRPSLQGGVAATAQRLMSDYMSRLGPKPSGTDDERDEAKARARAITGRFSVYAPDANELDAKEFRAALKENMMRDREKRRSGALKGGQLASDYMSRLSSGGSQ